MTQWSDLPREVQVEIIKFAIADILQDHIDRVPPGHYWGRYPEYIDTDPEWGWIDPRTQEPLVDNEYIHFPRDYNYERDMYTSNGDGCEIFERHESSQLTSMLVVTKAFLTTSELKRILLCCGHVMCPTPQSLSQFKGQFASKQRQNFRVMWVRPQNIPLLD